ncbi:unnamed protein product [Miscanthus lutarioriparius]|uniref:Uncharacterized protein n=1 Tax=Miscanthus lutarioriparius TaxID=422564 RepID=A0A811MV14_9POAL|nr:unnamed protein product [Miscanthus lutarioriparius]
MVRKQLAEKWERMIKLERKHFAGAVRLDSLPQQYAYFDCSIGDDDSLEIVSMSQAPQTQSTNNYDDKERHHVITY